MISTHKKVSVLFAVGLIAAAAALAGCSLLPFGQQAAQPAAGPAATPATGSASAAATASLSATQSAAVAASLTAAPLSDETSVPDVTGMDAKTALVALKEARLDYQLNWSGDAMEKSRQVVSQSPPAGSTVTSGTRVSLMASVGKGEGRPVPIWYFGTTFNNQWGMRGQGTVTSMEFFMPAHRWLLTSVLRMPISIYAIDGDGETHLIERMFKKNGKWWAEIHPMFSNEDQYIRLVVKTPNSTWWSLRYVFWTSAELGSVVGQPIVWVSPPGNEVPGVVSVPTAP